MKKTKKAKEPVEDVNDSPTIEFGEFVWYGGRYCKILGRDEEVPEALWGLAHGDNEPVSIPQNRIIRSSNGELCVTP